MRTDAALLLALDAVALAARLVPLTFSPLPYSIDGFPLIRIAEQITATGSWRIDPADVNSYNQMMPGFSLLWAAASMLSGLSLLAQAQLFVALIVSLTVVPAYLLGVKASGRRLVGFAAGGFVALFGSFLLLTSSVAKESIGLLVFPTVVLLFQERADPRKRGLAVVLLFLLPFLHHLTTLLTLGMVASLVVMTHRRALARGRISLRALSLDVITGPALAIPAWAYYANVSLPLLPQLLAPDAFVLFLALVVLLTALLAPMARPVAVRAGPRLGIPAARIVIPPAILVAVSFANAPTGLFAGALGTQAVFLVLLLPVSILAGFALAGYLLVRRTTNRVNDLVLAMLVPPTALILFGFLRSLDAASFVIVYRSVDFMDYALAITVGIAFVAAWNGLRPWPPARIALASGFFAALLATTPIAWNTQAVFGVDNVTTTEEYQALALLASFGAKNVTTDQRLADVGGMWFGYATDSSLPLKLRDNEKVTGYAYAILLERWTTVGAQLHPAPNIVLSRPVLIGFLATNRVVYAGGSPGDRVFLVQLLT